MDDDELITVAQKELSMQTEAARVPWTLFILLTKVPGIDRSHGKTRVLQTHSPSLRADISTSRHRTPPLRQGWLFVP